MPSQDPAFFENLVISEPLAGHERPTKNQSLTRTRREGFSEPYRVLEATFPVCGRPYRLSLKLLQLRVLRLGFLQDGNVRVGVFPKGEEILISGAGLCRIALRGVGAREAEMS